MAGVMGAGGLLGLGRRRLGAGAPGVSGQVSAFAAAARASPSDGQNSVRASVRCRSGRPDECIQRCAEVRVIVRAEQEAKQGQSSLHLQRAPEVGTVRVERDSSGQQSRLHLDACPLRPVQHSHLGELEPVPQ
eukprot:scaffold5747_cov128-Isochrysis_galbana.AAC.4